MAFLRSVLVFAVVGTLLGVLGGTLTAPMVVRGDLCGFAKENENMSSCTATVEKATAGVIHYQGYGAGGGALLGIVAGIVWSARKKKKPADAVVPAAPRA